MPKVHVAFQTYASRKAGIASGNRIRLSADGLRLLDHGRRTRDEEGIVTAMLSPTAARVKWDHYKHRQTISTRYIERTYEDA